MTDNLQPLPVDPEPMSSARVGAKADFPVVGIGASAGGLVAFENFFRAMPPDADVAFVLVPHLAPTHESLLPQLLAKYTAMPVQEAREGMRIEPNHVYVIPPNHFLTIKESVLHLATAADRQPLPLQFDVFLRSLADERRELAIAIVLSGTGQWGVLGAREIRSLGGLTIAQDPSTAEFRSMPQALIAAGLADYVLPPERMPKALQEFLRHYHVRSKTAAEEGAEPSLSRILALLREQAKCDFRPYRTPTLRRRIGHRMALNQIDDTDEYLAFLRDDPDEARKLARDLLINVSSFFRDPEAFQLLATTVIPDLISTKPPEAPIRVWTPGCATGEEPYSIAMLFHEQISATGSPLRLRIFATDIDEESLAVARRGVYSESIQANVSPERLRQFFDRTDDVAYQVSRQLRDSITFAVQNALSDPPFSRLDLISCRNLLIYLEPEIQRRLIGLFHLALNPGGYLLLGASETIGNLSGAFETVSKKWRCYRRRGGPRLEHVSIPVFVGERGQASGTLEAAVAAPPDRHAHIAQQLLLAEYAPAAVLVDLEGEIQYFHGQTRMYLDQPTGVPTRNLFAMARPGLLAALRAATHRVSEERCAVTGVDVFIQREDGRHAAQLAVLPAAETQDAGDPLMLVVFQEKADSLLPWPVMATEAATYVSQLEKEVTQAHDDLQRFEGELRASNEESKAASAQMQSLNEELQSSNEELETSKEELQSLNEELNAVNAELRESIVGLETSNNDLANLLNSIDTATVFLTVEGRIRRFTPAAVRLFHLIPTDVGRMLIDIAPRFANSHLHGDMNEVLCDGTAREKEVRTSEGACYLQRILPYRTVNGAIEGAVIVYSDVTLLKQAEFDRQQNRQLKRLAAALRESNDAVQIRDLDGVITDWNRGSERLYGYSESEAVGMNVRQLIPPSQFAAEQKLTEKLLHEEALTFWETQRIAKDGRVIDVWITANAIRRDDGSIVAISSVERDITQRKREEESLRQASERMAAIVNTAAEGIVCIDERGVIESFNAAAEELFQYAAADVIGQNVKLLMPPPYHNAHDDYLNNYLRTGVKRIIGIGREVFGKRRDGTVFPMELAVSEALDGQRRVFTGIVRDVTERKRAEKERQSSAVIRSSNEAITCQTSDGVITDWNPAAERLYGYSAPEAVGKPITFLSVPESVELVRGLVARTALGQSVNNVETVRLCKDGRRIDISLSMDPVRDDQGAIIGIMEISRDISERKLLERQLLDEERWRFGQDLHDEIGQELTALAFIAEGAATALEKNNRPEAALTSRVAAGIKEAIARVRLLSRRYIPLDVNGADLDAALAELAARTRSSYCIDCEFRFDSDGSRIDKTIAGHLFRIAQEAVTNSVKHGRSTRVDIRLDCKEGCVELAVEDNGSGIPPAQVDTGGMGLRIMRHRAALINARLRIDASEAGGVRVRCIVGHGADVIE